MSFFDPRTQFMHCVEEISALAEKCFEHINCNLFFYNLCKELLLLLHCQHLQVFSPYILIMKRVKDQHYFTKREIWEQKPII